MSETSKPKEPSPDQLKAVAVAIFRAIRSIDSELLAYKMALIALKEAFPEQGAFFSVGIQLAKNSSQHQRILHERYDASLEQILAQVQDEDYLIRAVKAAEENSSKPLN